MTDTLLAQVRTTEAARREYFAVKDAWDTARVRLEDSCRDLIHKISEAKHAVEVAEENLRALALAEYDRTKQKKVAPGVSIALKAALIYEKEKAEAWAREHRICLIPEQVDLKAFEGIAKTTNLPFVETQYQPTVRLDTDLGAALAAAEVPTTQEVS